MLVRPKLFAWSVLRQQWFLVLNVFGSPAFMPTSAAAIRSHDVAITMPSGVVSRPTSKV